MNSESQTRNDNWRPLALMIVIVAALLVVFFRFVPTGVRGYNFVPAGAMLILAGARLRPGLVYLLPLLPLLATDFYFYQVKGYAFPFFSYVCYALYTMGGWWLLRNSEKPLRIGTMAIVGSIQFFLITNFGVWLGHALNPAIHANDDLRYSADIAGLLHCYEMGIPFARGTFLSDIVFTGMFFAAHAILARKWFPAERVDFVASTEARS
jgi:hypothetical protein